jgi:hypothetical protein
MSGYHFLLISICYEKLLFTQYSISWNNLPNEIITISAPSGYEFSVSNILDTEEDGGDYRTSLSIIRTLWAVNPIQYLSGSGTTSYQEHIQGV